MAGVRFVDTDISSRGRGAGYRVAMWMFCVVLTILK